MKRVRLFFLLGGVALLVLGGVTGPSQLVPYIETSLYSLRIPTAPPLSAPPVASDALRPVSVTMSASSDERTDVDGQPTPGSKATETLASVGPSLPTEMPQGEEGMVSPQPRLSPTATPVSKGSVPMALSIPSIDLQAPIVPIGWRAEVVDGATLGVWAVPDRRAVGWHRTSALLGVPGNTVFNGHNTSNGEVFRDLYRVEVGDLIFVQGEDERTYVYRVGEKYILREAGQPLSVRLENARYIQETPDERLTLVTCHPYGSLANRLIVIAFPVRGDDLVRKGVS